MLGDIAEMGAAIVQMTILALVAGACVLGYDYYQKCRQAAIAADQLKIAKKAVDETAHNVACGKPHVINDFWGEPLEIETKQDEYGVSAKVTSKGPDKVAKTADDIVADKLVVNLTRTAGYIIGAKAKEFGQGVWDGVKHPIPFREKEKKDGN